MFSFSVAFLAMLLDRLFGEPKQLWSTAPHPVVLMGRSIFWLEKKANADTLSSAIRKRNGILSLLALCIAWVGGTCVLLSLLPASVAWWFEAIGGAILIAHSSLVSHVRDVAEALRTGGIEAGRKSVAMIVGRDPNSLDESGVSRAAIESAAENFSDGVIAPLFWLCVAGLPGIVFYKLVNTADSMIGHKSERFAHYGWASARLDDVINLPASRISAVLFVLTAWLSKNENGEDALNAWRRDAAQHKSPNAGHPEAAMAGALGLALAGPRTYDTGIVDDPYMNPNGRKEANDKDIDRAIDILNGAWLLAFAAVIILSIWS